MISILLINFWKKPGMADRTWKILSGIEVGIIVLMAFTIFLMMSDSVIVLECLGNSVCGPD
jgi:hypothetical protein